MKPDDGRPAKTTRCDKKRSESILKKAQRTIYRLCHKWMEDNRRL